ncbi:GAF domain-containing protein [Nocardia mexicana]|uniref:GAF domain-containing protein n=1 Tax=Nocardia mexicana TaxID=279262 RepID=A0A370HJ68_9NOCA|nr:GAF domain-containing protein [Nocardia mexicana]RDI55529.1 GAF domain-containing protein [Nocardia mexicana]
MSSLPDEHQDIAEALRLYALELQRAANAAAIAERHEEQAKQPPASMRPFRQRMATLHRTIEARHRACARLHRLYALRLQKWRATGAATRRPVFMMAVADQLRVRSAAVVLFDDEQRELLAATSDAVAQTVHELETVTGAGPALDIAAGQDHVLATDPDFAERWPEFGVALADLGVRTVLAVPLLAASRRLGALCLYSGSDVLTDDAVTGADRVADVLANTVLLTGSVTDAASDGMSPRGALFDDADFLTDVNQAAGVVAVQCSCDPDTALTLLRARAFAESVPLPELAHRVLDEGYRLC